MSFNGSGTYVPPAGQPVATGTVIQSVMFNTLVTDIGNTFNNVLPRDGQASMSGQLKLIDGTSSVPGIAFNSEASSGIFRPASGMLALVAAGVEGLRLNSSGRMLIGSTTDDATNKLQVTGAVKITGALTATGTVSAASFIGPVTGNVTGTATNVTGIVAIANGGTGATTGASAAQSLGVVQQGTGIGQSINVVKLGWGASTGGLKVTIDSTDQGYIPFSSTNPVGNGMVTFVSPVTMQTLITTGGATVAGNSTFGAGVAFNSGIAVTGGTTMASFGVSGASSHSGLATFGGGLNLTSGAWTSQVPLVFNGTPPSLSQSVGTGFIQLGAATGTNMAMVDNQIQARNNGTGSTLYLNYNGGPIQIGGGAGTTSVAVSGQITSTSQIVATGQIVAGTNLYANSGYVQAGSSGGTGTYTTFRFDGAMSQNGNTYAAILNSSNYAGALGFQPLGSGLFGFAPNGLTEVGRYLDWHSVNNANDFDVRFDCQNPTGGSGTSVMAITASALVCSGNITANSDETLKTNWRFVDDDFLTGLSRVKSGIYDRLDMHKTTQMGVSAQSLQNVAPHGVLTNSDSGLLSVAYGNVALVASIELSKKVLALEAELTALRNLINASPGGL